jgi:predicted DNA-binding protein
LRADAVIGGPAIGSVNGDRLAAAARDRGTTSSTLIHEAVERYLAS